MPPWARGWINGWEDRQNACHKYHMQHGIAMQINTGVLISGIHAWNSDTETKTEEEMYTIERTSSTISEPSSCHSL